MLVGKFRVDNFVEAKKALRVTFIFKEAKIFVSRELPEKWNVLVFKRCTY